MNALIVTLELDETLHRELTQWRTRFFPPERNYLDAHVTLFHALPGEHLACVDADLAAAANARPAFPVRVADAFSLGRGVALAVEADEIQPLRRRLREAWLGWLTPQDQRPTIRPHVTVQNKVSVDEARRTLDELRAAWPRATVGRARGLGLWEYRGGPWARVAEYAFAP